MNYKKYLPSKDFQKKISISLGVFLILFLALFVINKIDDLNFERKLKTKDLKTIEDYVKKDTDSDGLMDWEEELWGTDKAKKNTFEVPDLQYIENKKKELGIKTESEFELNELTETDKFAREFFSTYTALKSSGEVDSLTLMNLYSSLGQKITNSSVEKKYALNDVNIKNDSSSFSTGIYYQDIREVFSLYREKGMGDEIDIISNALINHTNKSYSGAKSSELLLISEAYSGFTKELLSFSVPDVLAENHLELINSSESLAKSVFDMSKVIDDPVLGLTGLSVYQKESENFTQAIQKIEDVVIAQEENVEEEVPVFEDFLEE